MLLGWPYVVVDYSRLQSYSWAYENINISLAGTQSRAMWSMAAMCCVLCMCIEL